MKAFLRALMPAAMVLGLAANPVQAGSDRLRIHLAAWPTELSGSQEVDGDTVSGTAANFSSTLGIGSKTLPELHMDLKMLGPFHIVGSYFSGSFRGEETLTESVTFNDVVYSVSEQVRSNVDVDVGKVLGSFSVLSFKRLGLGLMVGASLMDMKSQLESSASGQSRKGFTAPIPVVGVNLRLQPIEKLAIYAELSGLSVNVGGVDATSIDGLVRVEYFFLPQIGITGGFRILDLNVEKKDFGAIDFQQDGAQLGVVFRL